MSDLSCAMPHNTFQTGSLAFGQHFAHSQQSFSLLSAVVVLLLSYWGSGPSKIVYTVMGRTEQTVNS